MNEPERQIVARLKEITKWRNRIAHEQDINPQFGGIELWPISHDDVASALDFLERLGFAIAKAILIPT